MHGDMAEEIGTAQNGNGSALWLTAEERLNIRQTALELASDLTHAKDNAEALIGEAKLIEAYLLEAAGT